jgi:hypothetical protein
LTPTRPDREGLELAHLELKARPIDASILKYSRFDFEMQRFESRRPSQPVQSQTTTM